MMDDIGADTAAHAEVLSAADVARDAVTMLKTITTAAAAAAHPEPARAQGEPEMNKNHVAQLEKKIASLKDKYQAAVDAVGPGGHTPLLLVCMQGSVTGVAALLALGADPTAEGDVFNTTREYKYKCSPCILAARDGHIGIVKMLLACGRVDANDASSDNGVTALSGACQSSHLEIIMLLLTCDNIDVNKERIDGATPLIFACQLGYAAVVKLLLASDGIDVNKTTPDGGTPLSMACQRGHVESIKLLLAHNGIDVNKALLEQGPGAGYSPLMAACVFGHIDVIRVLLADGRVNIEMTTTDGRTALHIAVEGYQVLLRLAASQLLTVYGANIHTISISGHTPAQRARAINKPLVAEWLNAVASWSQLRVAAGCRLHKDAALLLRQGRMDPDDPTTTTVKDLLDVIATANMKPTELPWQNAPQICKATQKLVIDATRGWHRTTHYLHHRRMRRAVLAVVVVVIRLEKKYTLLQDKEEDDGLNLNLILKTPSVQTWLTLPVLPIDLWFHALGFCKRSWWVVEQ